ncbi:putative membrane protein YphA (DoxX/SURF4 family) [Microbacterium sp. W4I4]|uniref:MauE/DoxX family redox-associated membrane protein n=1 Tax=Microbacterium sp. W4I4 TaxID=3042295 RepID=UPI00278A20AD|nr:MauE/DoxX family redox-associated membrane protein [Microbacterium sp. W4I4]MDQ0613756.1 putative membrane protein YphA (DoxX/SURF4 family) [Microbacterium sp. W4I4]
MHLALTITPALIVAVVLLVSGIAKLRTPDDEAGWEELGVPAALRVPWLMRLHPIAEIVLALGLLLLGGVLGVLAAIVATLLFLVYLVMVWLAKRRTPDASCACFGARKPITGRTLLRNGWLALLSVLAAVGLSAAPLFGGVLAMPAAWPWVLALAAVAVTFVLIDQPDDVEPPVAAVEDDVEEYIRVRTPAVSLTLGDGSAVNLRTLAARQPILLLAVSETCGACRPVIESAPRWRELLPELSVRLLVRTMPEQSPLTSAEEPQTLHDPYDYVRSSIADWQTPTALLLGIDGLLAGGPVTGEPAIEEFVGDVYESLHGIRPPA